MFCNSAWIFCAILLCCGNICLVDSENTTHSEGKFNHVPSISNQTETSALSQPQGTPNETSTKLTSTQTSTSKTETTSKTEATSAATTHSTNTDPTSSSPTTLPATPTSTTTHTPSSPSSSTSTPPSTTSIPVTPTPGPQKGSWNVTDSKRNITCIRIDGTFSIDYNYIFNKTAKTLHLDIPRLAHANGSCDGKIELGWENDSNSYSLVFIFKKNDTKKDATKYVLAAFRGQVIVPKLHLNETFNSNTHETHFETPVNQSYSCSAMKQIRVDNHTKVTLEDFHLQAFKVSNTTNFDASVDCAGNHPSTPDIVPIVVGCVLALLVIAVLVAYLISRRRSATRGYLSM